MQLRQAEPLGVLDDHDRGIGHVDAHLDDSGRHEDMGPPAGKEHHLVVFLGGLHAPVYHRHAVMREHVLDLLITLLQGMKV